MKGCLDQLFVLEPADRSAADSKQLRVPTLEERVELYLHAVYGNRDFTNEEYSRARSRMLDAMAANVVAKSGEHLGSQTLPRGASRQPAVIPTPPTITSWDYDRGATSAVAPRMAALERNALEDVLVVQDEKRLVHAPARSLTTRRVSVSAAAASVILSLVVLPITWYQSEVVATATLESGAGADQNSAGRQISAKFGDHRAEALRQGKTEQALPELEYAAEQGVPGAIWTLGRMYADGDGVKMNKARAYEYFRRLAATHGDVSAGTPNARYLANAFVTLGLYHLDGIPGTLKADPNVARETFRYAAAHYADPEAQYYLGRLYLEGNGAPKDASQAARWRGISGHKGTHRAQALLGSMLFKGEDVPRRAALLELRRRS